MFSLGEGGEPLPGVGLPHLEVHQILGCCSEHLPSHIPKVGAKNWAG